MGKKITLELPYHFEFNPNNNSVNMPLTFMHVPLYDVLEIFDQRLELVKNPNTRQEKLAEFYSK